jgi:hypothetical protein
MNYSSAAGEQIQNYLDPNRPDYGGIVLATSESGSALKRALMALNADVAGTKLMYDASLKAAEMDAAGIKDRANAGTFAAGASAFGKVAGAAIGAIPLPGSGGTEEIIGLGDGFNIGKGQAGLDPAVDLDRYLTSSPLSSIST